MQALIDFDGWRKWKDISQSKDDSNGKAGGGNVANKAVTAKVKRDKARSNVTAAAPTTTDMTEPGKVIAAGA